MTALTFDPRYARQLTLRGFGPAAQERLAAARVLVVGAGGLGAPVSMYLAAAGVGAISMVDTDEVDLTNLHRQLLYGTSDVGRRKLDAARERLADINPHVALTLHDMRLTAANASTLIAGHDVVVDATDNFPARYAINDACLQHGVPFVYGSVARFQGQVSVFASGDGPCYRCLFPEPPPPGSVPTCAEEGVLGVVPGIVGLHQANETIKLIAGIGTPLVGRLLLLDLLENDFRSIAINRRANCVFHSSPDTRVNSPLSFSSPVPQLTAPELAARLQSENAPQVLDVREQWEYDIAHLPSSRLIPLSELQVAVSSLEKDGDYVLLCHHGMRSEMAAQWLQGQGFTRVANLAGGIDGWVTHVDSTMSRY
ncbi:MAG TPA: molybdopterin-synthase adenylyltransferase MoeB [Gemmatimonas sp.]|nr:molybdopterin-synthase adenylyltransferase MoeB [Gemmatimonas sp.]